MLEFKKLWEQALTFDEFVESCRAEYCDLWKGVYSLARVPEWARAAVPSGAVRKLLVIAEDWCGDASNTVPIIAKFADSVPGIELRVILRDQNPEVMSRYLTNGARSIPIVIALDESYQELGHWGPRPTELQAWVMENRGSTPKSELYPKVRKWYARDRGETTLREVLEAAGFAVARVA
ncbi:MAG TPA: thioredoxin family protein [Gemmatimonadales bacterium]|nr:thioredoxin family protein [Gemmatimonadales bacterium]